MLYRPRRLRSSAYLRDLVRETTLGPADLVMPLFATARSRTPQPVASMPGVDQLPIPSLLKKVEPLLPLGLRAVLLFGIPTKKDDSGSGAWAPEGIVQEATRALKAAFPDLVVITDVCLCEYTRHGHCGVLTARKGRKTPGVDNDRTLPLLAQTAVSHAEAGADIVAPSDMMDGRVAAIRKALDDAGHAGTGILSYAAKYSSAHYGPFRDAAESAPAFGDRRTYQMDLGNTREAIREVAFDIEEGADILMVKPGLICLDILARIRERFDVPLAAYSVSGEYAMLKAAAQNGWINEREAASEQLLAFKRAGADFVVTYWAEAALRWLGE